MTRDDVIRMARECGHWTGQTGEMNDVGLQAFAAIVAAAEREECIKECEGDAFVDQWYGLAEAVKRIRARGGA